MEHEAVLPFWAKYVFGILFVAGGTFGAAMTATVIRYPKLWTSASLFLVLYCVLALFGTLLLLERLPRTLLLLALLLQSPYISCSLLSYKFAAGAGFYVLVGSTTVPNNVGFYSGWDSIIGSSWFFNYGHDLPFRIGLNIVPMIALVVVARKQIVQNP